MIVLRNAGVVVFNICMNYICTVYHLFIDQYKVLMNFRKPVKCQCNFLKYHEYDHSPKDYGLGMLCSYTCNAHQNFNITNPIGNLQRY